MTFITTPRTLELFVKSLLSKALQVTLHRNAKTLSPSHVKQCILAEARFDFLRDLVKNIPDVTAAEERELMSREDSPTRLSDTTVRRRVVREDSNSSSSSDVRVQATTKDNLRRAVSLDADRPRNETVTSEAIDLSKKLEDKPVVSANFYQETLAVSETQHKSVITLNPTYATPQPSTSNYAGFKRVMSLPDAVSFPTYASEASKDSVAPILNIDFSKNLAIPEIKVLDNAVAGIVGVPKEEKKIHRQNSKKSEVKKVETSIPKPLMPPRIDIDHLNSGNLQIDEDYDT